MDAEEAAPVPGRWPGLYFQQQVIEQAVRRLVVVLIASRLDRRGLCRPGQPLTKRDSRVQPPIPRKTRPPRNQDTVNLPVALQAGMPGKLALHLPAEPTMPGNPCTNGSADQVATLAAGRQPTNDVHHAVLGALTDVEARISTRIARRLADESGGRRRNGRHKQQRCPPREPGASHRPPPPTPENQRLQRGRPLAKNGPPRWPYCCPTLLPIHPVKGHGLGLTPLRKRYNLNKRRPDHRRTQHRYLIVSGVLAALLATPVVKGELPDSGHARYWIQDGGQWIGYETFQWSLEDEGYRFEKIRDRKQQPAAPDAGDRRLQRTREISEGTLDEGAPQPERYEVHSATVFQAPDAYDPDTAFDDAEEELELAVRFTDDEGELEEDEIAVPPGAHDPLSHRWQLMREAAESGRRDQLRHDVVGEDGELEEIVFRVEGRRTVRAHPGTFRTLRLARRTPGQQRTERWYLADDGWAGLPVRTVRAQTERQAQRTRLERIEAGGL